MTWKDLLTHPRVVILSGGGAGKTWEIRQRAKLLHAEGKPAFFLRIEHVRDDFAGAFDKAAGNHEQFLEWVRSGDEGWIFLDSVDEARLRSPKEFEQAINYVGRALKSVLARAHIVVTGREAAWRARTDRELIRTLLPYESSSPTRSPVPSNKFSVPRSDEVEGRVESGVDELDLKGAGDSQNDVEMDEGEDNAVLVVGFDALDETQVETFARAKGVADVADFMKAVRRKEAQSETARPLDLDGLVDYWNTHNKIGDQFELTDASIRKRLSEVDPDRAEATTLTRDELRQAARLLAVANILMQTPDIRLLDATGEVRGVEPGDLLDWPEKDIRTLLLRPLFIASQFGAVRIYTQKAREFLAAEWLHQRLVDHASRARIEALFFRAQYGCEVVVPSMRGVLPWLALLDVDVLGRTRRVAPEVMFEGGDPSRLPLEMRRDLLSKACAQLKDNAGGRSLTDFLAVQRFAAPDLADHIKALLAKYRAHNEVVYFLMRMVWQGEVSGALDEAKLTAINSGEISARRIAIRAVASLGTDADRKIVREALLGGRERADRELIAEAIEGLPGDLVGVTWLLQACAGAKPARRYSVDPLQGALEGYVSSLPIEYLPHLTAGLQHLLEPSGGDMQDEARGHQPYEWLLGAAITTLNRLVEAKHSAIFDAPAMAMLLRIPTAVRFGDNQRRTDSERLGEHVAEWAILNRALFWADVERVRKSKLAKSGEPLIDFWHVGIFGHYWRLTSDDFDYIENEISARPLLDDRLVALSAAHWLYRNNGRPPKWRKRLRFRAQGVPELESTLSSLLGPQPAEVKKWRRQEARLKERSAREAARRDANREEWRKYLPEHLDTLRTPFPGGGVRRNQQYLLDRMREFDKNSSRWTDGKWQSLVPEFGHDVAEAFRDGAMAFWRTNTPELLSSGAQANTTSLTTIFGLTGLLFESRASRDWARRLNPEEAELAARYAMRELNGFPPWLPRLFAAHPDAVMKVVLGEIDYELRATNEIDTPSQYVLSDVGSVGGWLWQCLAPELITRLNSPPPNAAHLREVLSILAGSDVNGADIASVARRFALKSVDELAAIWLAAWVGVAPDEALPALEAHLEALGDKARQRDLAMHFLIDLVGGRRKRRVARDAYRTAAHLTTLILLMQKYIVEDEDLNRTDGGVYSPTLRDDAQEARNSLLARLRDTPGPEAYFALTRIAAEHPSKRGREWAAWLAKARAIADADRVGSSSSQVREFRDTLERTPSNHQELHDMAIERLIDVKYFLENGETSIAEVLLKPKETAVRNVIANLCKDRGLGRYLIAQEEEFADKKRTDIRFRGIAFDNPVPVELKLANLWSGPDLVERLENQLCNDYLRDVRSSNGIFLLVDQGGRKYWDLPGGNRVMSTDSLAAGLRAHWAGVAKDFPHVRAVEIIAIDLTARTKPKGRRVGKKWNRTPTKGNGGQGRAKTTPKMRSAKVVKKATNKSSRAPSGSKRTSARRSPLKKPVVKSNLNLPKSPRKRGLGRSRRPR